MKIDGKASTRHVHKKENLNITGWQNGKLQGQLRFFYNNFFDSLKNDK